MVRFTCTETTSTGSVDTIAARAGHAPALATPPDTDTLHFAISPYGRSVVALAPFEGESRLWIRPFQSEEGRPLVGTERAAYPFWSPDGRSVGFFADRELRRVDLASGLVRTVASAPDPRAGAWNSDGTIVFGSGTGPLYKVKAEGGAIEEATTLLPGQSNHRRPQFLPDGRRFLLLALGAADVRGIYLGSLDRGAVRRVLDSQVPFAFLPPGHVLLAQQGALWAQWLNAEYTQGDGEPVPVAPRVLVARDLTGFAALSSSAAGAVAFRASSGERHIVWLDRTGRELGVLGPPDDAQIGNLRLSPDGRTVAAVRSVSGKVTLSPPASVHRFGLAYSEIRGTIEGIGWGGMPISLKCHYEYELSYVIRIPHGWEGGLVVYRHGAGPLALWEGLEADLGERSIGRVSSFRASGDQPPPISRAAS